MTVITYDAKKLKQLAEKAHDNIISELSNIESNKVVALELFIKKASEIQDLTDKEIKVVNVATEMPKHYYLELVDTRVKCHTVSSLASFVLMVGDNFSLSLNRDRLIDSDKSHIGHALNICSNDAVEKVELSEYAACVITDWSNKS